MSEYTLANKLDSYRVGIALVGCGGTGGFAAEGLCRLLRGSPVKLHLIDGDRVEERNLGRQNFWPEDLGRFKAQALAERLARKYGVPIAYTTAPLLAAVHSPLDGCGVVVGCVDNAPARAAIARSMAPSRWWVDAGNGAEFGQVLVGNAAQPQLARSFDPARGLCHALPVPTWVRPELLVPAPRPQRRPVRRTPDSFGEPDEGPSCAGAGEAGEQGPTINQLMAALVVEVVRRLLEGKLTWWQVYLDMEAGSLRTVPATPEGVARLTGIKKHILLAERR